MNTSSWKQKITGLLGHLLLFIVVEILFVFLILHEIPHLSLFEAIGIVHVTYFIVVIIAGLIRQYATTFWQRFLCTYTPILYHVLGHIYIIYATVEHIHEHTAHHHEEHNVTRLIIATISAGILVFVGEWLLHKKYHCDSHHQSVHKHCKEQ